MLGHCPEPSLNDPKFIDGASWMHPVTGILLLGFLPAGCVALVLNVHYAVTHRVSGKRLLLGATVVAALWVGTVGLLRWDPGLVVYWWID